MSSLMRSRYFPSLLSLIVAAVATGQSVSASVFPFARESRITAHATCGSNSNNDSDSTVNFAPYPGNVIVSAGCDKGSAGSNATQDSEFLFDGDQIVAISATGTCNTSATGTSFTGEDNVEAGSRSRCTMVFSVFDDSVNFVADISVFTSETTSSTAFGNGSAYFYFTSLTSSEIFSLWSVYSDDPTPSFTEHIEIRLAPGIYLVEITVNSTSRVESYVNAGSADGYAGFDLAIEFKPDRKLRIINDLGNRLANTDVTLSHSAYDIPNFSESMPTHITTDDSGLMVLPPGFDVGDSIKVHKVLHSEPAKKHQGELATVYSICIDNAEFDSLGGMIYQEVLDSTTQTVVLGHTTIHWNLLVSIEWDAHLPYLQNTEVGFRHMANYLYDVTDGQVVFDTILIFDARGYWDVADIQVHASNMEWPRATAKGWLWATYDNGDPTTTHMPRQFFGNSDDTRAMTFTNDPLDLSDPLDYRTRGHELGHYLLGFRDEYIFAPAGATKCANDFLYGYMESQYLKVPAIAMASEMSNAQSYSVPACQNTSQWSVHAMSCWNLVQKDFEKSWGPQTIFAPIDLPGESELIAPNIFFIGPNEDPGNLDYDVGAKIVFPIIHAAPSGETYTLGVIDQSALAPVGNTNVKVLKTLSFPPHVVNQGNTTDDGFIKLLGINLTDIIHASGYYTHVVNKSGAGHRSSDRGWLFGESTVGVPGQSRLGNDLKQGSGNALTLTLIPVAGDLQFIAEMAISDLSTQLRLEMDAAFIQSPTLEQAPDGGFTQVRILTADSGGYVGQWNEPLNRSGEMRIRATDDSSRSFFVDCPYAAQTPLANEEGLDLFAKDGSASLSLDATGNSITMASVLTSYYPVLRHGLGTDNLQAGAAQSVSFFPALSLNGSNSLTIRYAESDLGDRAAVEMMESTLRVFHWSTSLRQWEPIGGIVDTALDMVSVDISEVGVYAAFTSSTGDGCCSGIRGNTNNSIDQVIDILDLTYLVSYMFKSGPPPQCLDEANVNGTATIDILDLTYLVSWMFKGGPEPISCP